jgi:hypothetical protein
MARMGFLLMKEIMAAIGLLWGHNECYMGLKFGVFWQTGAFKRPDFWGLQSDGFMGVFWGVGRRERSNGTGGQ